MKGRTRHGSGEHINPITSEEGLSQRKSYLVRRPETVIRRTRAVVLMRLAHIDFDQ